MDAVGIVCTVALGLLLVFVFREFLLKERFSDHEAKLPPGSFGWPFLGDTIFLMSCWRRNNLADFFDSKTRSYGPIFKTSIFGMKTAVLPAPEGTSFIYANEGRTLQSFYRGTLPLFGKASVGSVVGEEHRRTKGIIIASLRPEILREFVGQMSRVAVDHLDKFWTGNSVVPVFDLMKKFTFHLSCNLLVGLALDDQAMEAMTREFNTMAAGLLTILQLDYPGSTMRKAKAARKALDAVLDERIGKRKQELELGRASPKQDLFSVLITAAEESAMPNADEFIKDNIVTLLSAGHDTSTGALTSVFRYLAENPSCLDRVLQEQASIAELDSEDLKKMTYTWQVIQEAMRMSPILPATFRRAIADTDFQGYTIPKGWQVLCYTSGPHKDEAVFQDPETFSPSRFDKSTADQRPKHTFVPFGGGARICPGSDFAKAEMLVFLHHCVLKFAWTLAEPNLELVMTPGTRPAKGMPIHLHARSEAEA